MLTGDHLRDRRLVASDGEHRIFRCPLGSHCPWAAAHVPFPEMAASDPAEPLPTWPRHDPAAGFGLALIVGAVVVGLVVVWRWLR